MPATIGAELRPWEESPCQQNAAGTAATHERRPWIYRCARQRATRGWLASYSQMLVGC